MLVVEYGQVVIGSHHCLVLTAGLDGSTLSSTMPLKCCTQVVGICPAPLVHVYIQLHDLSKCSWSIVHSKTKTPGNGLCFC